MTDKTPPRRPPTFAGDDERVAAGAEHREREREAVPHAINIDDSLPVIVDDSDEHTPVEQPRPRHRPRKTVQEFAEDTKLEIRALRRIIDEIKSAAHQSAMSSANHIAEAMQKLSVLEERLRQMDGLNESIEEFRTLKQAVAELRVALVGADGTNGKIGNLRADHEQHTADDEEVHSRLSSEVVAEVTSAITALRKEIWGDDLRKAGDPPVIIEARRGKWILRSLAGIAIASITAAGYIVKDAVHNDGATQANVAASQNDIKVLQSQVQLLFSKMTLGTLK